MDDSRELPVITEPSVPATPSPAEEVSRVPAAKSAPKEEHTSRKAGEHYTRIDLASRGRESAVPVARTPTPLPAKRTPLPPEGPKHSPPPPRAAIAVLPGRKEKSRERVLPSAPPETRTNRIAQYGALGLFFSGWLLAVVFGHGFDLYRLYWPSVLTGLGALAFLVSRPRQLNRLPGLALPLLYIGLAYFLVRAWFSPVWDLARLDLPLICGFGLAFLLGCARPGWKFVTTVLVAVAIAHAATGIYQHFFDPTFAAFRGARENAGGISGLYLHRTYLAGYLGILMPVLVSLLMCRGHLGRWPTVTLWSVFLLSAAVLVLTLSRAGVASAAVGCFVTFLAINIDRWRRGTTKNRAVIVATAVAGLLVFINLLVFLIRFLFESRGKAEELATGYVGLSRLRFSGMAFDRWIESILFGQGSRSYSYQSIADWAFPVAKWRGSPDMVHNDYLQTLTEYGAIGLLLILALVIWLYFRSARAILQSRKIPQSSGPAWIDAAILGAVAAVAMHAVVDFSMHILPNLMIIGLLMGMAAARHGKPLRSASPWNWKTLLAPAGALALTTLWISAGWRELTAIPSLARFERVIYSAEPTTTEYREALQEALERAPNFDLARQFGALELARATDPEATEEESLEASQHARDALALAVARHPYDGESLLNYGSALEFVEDPAAGDYYKRAIAGTWRREARYGGMFLYSLHLARLGEELLDQQEPGTALGVLSRSRDYLEESWRLKHRSLTQEEYEEQAGWLNELIDSLLDAGIEPAYPDSVPPPPAMAER